MRCGMAQGAGSSLVIADQHLAVEIGAAAEDHRRRGEYRAISPKALISIVAGLMYFLSPVDAIPDFIPMFGMFDDIAVLAWIMKTLDGELNAFRAWREAQRPEKLAVVERLPATPALLAQENPQKN